MLRFLAKSKFDLVYWFVLKHQTAVSHVERNPRLLDALLIESMCSTSINVSCVASVVFLKSGFGYKNKLFSAF